jgi:hypothetical protein
LGKWRERLGFAGWLEDERGVDVVIVVFPVVLNLLLPVFAKMIDSDAIGFHVDDGKQFCPELDEACVIDLAFENGVLDTLAVVEAGLGDLAEAFLAEFCDGGDVVGDQYVHLRFEI